MEIINTMKKSGSVRKAIGKRKTNKLGNYPMRKWKEFDKQLEQLKKLYGVGSGKVAIQLAIKSALEN